MSEKPGKSATDILRKHINSRLNKAEAERRIKEKNARIQDIRREKEAKTYENWLKGHRAESSKASGVIWGWYENFVASSIFKETINALWKIYINQIRISETIVCNVPDYGLEQQFLFIDSKKRLFVHNCVKYGESHPIQKREDLLQHVWGPILIAIAQTIKDDSIWGIIGSNIDSE